VNRGSIRGFLVKDKSNSYNFDRKKLRSIILTTAVAGNSDFLYELAYAEKEIYDQFPNPSSLFDALKRATYALYHLSKQAAEIRPVQPVDVDKIYHLIQLTNALQAEYNVSEDTRNLFSRRIIQLALAETPPSSRAS